MGGRPANDALVDEVEVALRDACRCGSLHAWGRPRRENNEQALPAITPIAPENWDHDQFAIMDGVSSSPRGLVRKVNTYGSYNYPGEVIFNKNEVLKTFQRQSLWKRLFDRNRRPRIELAKGARVDDG